MKTLLWPVVVVSLGLTLVGCNKNDGSATSTSAVTPARETSFTEVTSQLDPGGSVYGYLATDQWLAGLSTNVSQLKALILSMPDISESDNEDINRTFDLLAGGIAKSGMEDLTGVGLSSVQISAELHRSKLVLHHKQGHGDGLFWNVLGKEPHALTGLDFLTTNTAIAGFGDVDIAGLWKAIERGMSQSGIPDLAEGVKEWPDEFEKQTKLSWTKLLASFDGEVGLVLTLDNDNKIALPFGAEGLEIPTPGLLLAVKMNDDLLYDRISSELKKSQAVALTEEKGLKMCAMPIPVPLPVELQITVATSGDYFFLATSPTMVRNALAVRAGKLPGLRQTKEFAELLKHVPAQGNQFVYADKRFSGMIMELQKKAIGSQSKLDSTQQDFIRKLLLSQGPTYGLTVGAHTANGWQSVSVGNQDSSAALKAAVPALGAAMLLPAFAKAKQKAQSIACVNNLKQVGLAFRIWAGDNNDQFPFNVSTSKGGTLETCQRGGDGYDRSAYLHFQVMSNELATPKILVCPSDSAKQPAADFASLQSWNVSYQVRSGAKVTDVNPTEILTYCPTHHHTGYADGSVKQGPQKKR